MEIHLRYLKLTDINGFALKPYILESYISKSISQKPYQRKSDYKTDDGVMSCQTNKQKYVKNEKRTSCVL